MKITLATNADLSALAELERLCLGEESSEEALKLYCDGVNFAVLLKNEEKLISYCKVFCALDEGQIINVATREGYRGKGQATSVMQSVFNECKKRGICLLSLEVRKSNNPATALYKKLGFEIAGERKGFYKNPREDALIMTKNI